MTPEIQRAALRAAARLALSGALPALVVGCGGETEPIQTASVASPAASPPPENAAELIAKSPPKTCGATATTPPTVECCEQKVAEALFPPNMTEGQGPNLSVDSTVRACCTVLAQGTFHDFPRRQECCAAIGWGIGGSCTPWGPPVPPAMTKTAFLAG